MRPNIVAPFFESSERSPCSPRLNCASASTRSRRVSRVCGGTFDIDSCIREIPTIEARMAEPGFWDKQESAQKTVAQLKQFKKTLDDYQKRDSMRVSLSEMLAAFLLMI